MENRSVWVSWLCALLTPRTERTPVLCDRVLTFVPPPACSTPMTNTCVVCSCSATCAPFNVFLSKDKHPCCAFVFWHLYPLPRVPLQWRTLVLCVPVLPLVLPSTCSCQMKNTCVVCSCYDACTSSYVFLPNMQNFLLRFSLHALWPPRGRCKPSFKKEIIPPPPTLSCAMPSYNLCVYKKAMLHAANQTVSLVDVPWLRRSVAGWQCHGSDAQSPYCNGGGPVSIPGQPVWDLCCTKWHWDRLVSRYFYISCQHHSSNAPYSFTRCWIITSLCIGVTTVTLQTMNCSHSWWSRLV
jgi:hypothetical protein